MSESEVDFKVLVVARENRKVIASRVMPVMEALDRFIGRSVQDTMKVMVLRQQLSEGKSVSLGRHSSGATLRATKVITPTKE